MKAITTFVQTHFPIWYTNQPFCLIVLGLLALTFIFWFQSRSKAALGVLAAELCYLIPFIRA
ncbi:MAG TPA: hypothetical protein PLD59_13665 [Tepidisphaeraceae bacterium]|nr:hypothetical protein [Tepidisphaeraceae bacterium]